MAASASDDVAAKADGIIAHMNNDHKDSLAYLATHYGDLLRPLQPSQVLMTAIDRKHLEIVYTTNKGAAPARGQPGTKTVHVPFYPHLAGYSEVRQRLVDLSALSEKVVTTRKPEIVYRTPKLALHGLALLLLAYAALRSDTLASHGLVRSLVPEPRLAQWNTLRNTTLGGPTKMDWFVLSLVRLHVVEGALIALLCYFKGASRLVTLRWTLATLLVGVPARLALVLHAQLAQARAAARRRRRVRPRPQDPLNPARSTGSAV